MKQPIDKTARQVVSPPSPNISLYRPEKQVRKTPYPDKLLARMQEEYESQLAEKQRLAGRLASLLKGLPAGVVVLDNAGCIQEVNPAAEMLLGLPLVGMGWRDVIERSFAPDPQSGCDLRLADGRLVSLSTCPLGDEPGQILLLSDVTESRALQARASHNQRLISMGRMVASLAHQIRTPLSSALLYASHLKRSPLDEQERQQLADKILDRVRHLEQLLNDMLAFAHGGLGGGEQLDISELLLSLQKLVEPQFNACKATLVMDDQTTGQVVRCNRELLLSALQNLVTNALQVTAEGGEVTLGARREQGKQVAIIVADNGPGIEPQLQQKIFEPFITTRAEGSGLGLAVARGVAHAHHGELMVESEPGKGAVFYLYLPVIGDFARGACQEIS